MEARAEAHSEKRSEFSPETAPAELPASVRQVADQLGELVPHLSAPHTFLSDGAADDAADALLELVDAMEQLSGVVSAAQVALAGQVADHCDVGVGEESLAARRGCRNAVELLQRITRAPVRALKQRVVLAERVSPRRSLVGETLPARNPLVGAAFARGDLSLVCASQLSESLHRISATAAPDTVDTAERLYVETATQGETIPLDDDDMRTFCRAVENRIDQDGPAPKETSNEQLRGIRFGKERQGLVPITGALLPEVAALLARNLDAIISPRVKRPVRFETPNSAGASPEELAKETAAGAAEDATAGAAEGAAESVAEGVADDTPLVGDARNPEQKRHDALATILQTAARHPDTPLLGGAPVTVLVQVKEEDLVKNRSVGWLHGHDGTLEPVSLGSIRHASCAGTTMRVTQNSAGRIVELGNAGRVFNAHQRKALTLRDGGCVIPGCSVPASWCEIHHVTEHAAGGATHTDNGVLLCWYHHRSLDTSGWEIRMTAGVPEIKAPRWVDREGRWRRARHALQRADAAVGS